MLFSRPVFADSKETTIETTLRSFTLGLQFVFSIAIVAQHSENSHSFSLPRHGH